MVDFEYFEKSAKRFQPKLIVTGGSAYPRDWDYSRFAKTAKILNSVLMADISHFSGLVAAKILNDPFEHCDIVMSTTHKTLGGPRGALIFYKNELKSKINFSVFPHCQGGPHNNNIAAIAVRLKEISENKKKYVEDCEQIVSNAKELAKCLSDNGFHIMAGGTDTHLILWNLKKVSNNFL
ncbi:hypothetical protein MHBO_004067 [Bonamia ostreae]|uniref:Serine hydroxymethyltransferase-like domain-containing protein n=1 Tax=Bonamia ostreae TaxID=126728 RepID=A0ABV2AT45_9EUKA